MQILCFFLFKGSSKCGFSTLLSCSGFIICSLFASCIFIWTNKDDDDDDDDDTDVRIIVFPYKYIVFQKNVPLRLITHNFANSQHLLIGTNIPILINRNDGLPPKVFVQRRCWCVTDTRRHLFSDLSVAMPTRFLHRRWLVSDRGATVTTGCYLLIAEPMPRVASAFIDSRPDSL